MVKRVLFAAALLLAVSGWAWAFRDLKGLPSWNDGIIVEYKSVFDENDAADFCAAQGLKYQGRQSVIGAVESKFALTDVKPYATKAPFKTYKTGDPASLTVTVAAIKKLSFIDYAEPNYIRRALYTPVVNGPNDTYYQNNSYGGKTSQWGYNRVQADSAYALNHNGSIISPTLNKTVIVAVLDTGILLYHEDLLGMTVPGWNIIDNNSSANDTSSEGHGTFVSGIIAANTDNSLGIAGAAYSTGTAKVMLMPVRVLDVNGDGNDSDIYDGLVWAADHGANVINMSFGGPDDGITIQNGVNYAFANGCVLTAAAGNTGVQENFYPASYTNVISVGSLNSTDQKSDFSTYGKVDVSAPGEDILSTKSSLGTAYGYDYGNGTSFAAPFVSALAAHLLLINQGASPQRIRDIIEHTADDVGSTGYDNQTGWGRVNFVKALSNGVVIQANNLKTYNWPNPFSPDKDLFTNITFVIVSPQDVKIEIFDGGGNRVWHKDIDGKDVRYGYNTITWDARNMSGTRVANGTYFYVVKAGSTTGKNKISVLY